MVFKHTHRYNRDVRHGADRRFVCCHNSDYKVTDAPVVNVENLRFPYSEGVHACLFRLMQYNKGDAHKAN